MRNTILIDLKEIILSRKGAWLSWSVAKRKSLVNNLFLYRNYYFQTTPCTQSLQQKPVSRERVASVPRWKKKDKCTAAISHTRLRTRLRYPLNHVCQYIKNLKILLRKKKVQECCFKWDWLKTKYRTQCLHSPGRAFFAQECTRSGHRGWIETSPVFA